MCGRYNLRSTPKEMQSFFDLAHEPAAFSVRYNIAPTQTVPAIRLIDDKREAAFFRWGLIPFWAKDMKIGSSMINARADTVTEKPTYKAAFKRRRCLIPASGFYEWKPGTGKVKQPYRIHQTDNQLLAFAGLWETWDKGEAPVESCKIITTEANELMRPLHDRMPVILARSTWDVWLVPEVEADGLAKLLKPYEGADLIAEPVSTQVNNVRNDFASCVAKESSG